MEATRQTGLDARRTGMLVFLGSDAVTFATLLAAVAYLRVVKGGWSAGFLDVKLGLAMTAVLVASSVALYFKQRAVAVLLGAAFLGLQAWEWTHLDVPLAASHATASFHIITGFHGLHVAAGIVLLATIRRDLAALFWQFVDAVWIAIFVCVYLL